MYMMSGDSEIMTSDETLTCRTYNKVVGDGMNIVGGKRVYSEYEDFTFIGNVQPVTGDDLVLVPEGDRFNEQLFVWVPTSQGRVPDVNDLVYRDDWYQVQANEFWGSYGRLRIQRVDVGPHRALGA
jgi:hypothetical protein